MTDSVRDLLQRNLTQLTQRVQQACLRAARASDEVTIVAVTKSVPLDVIKILYELGCREFGESRPQQLQLRSAACPPDVHWHLIGHLQRNKAAPMCRLAQWIHSVDSWRLMERLATLIPSEAPSPRILLEVNVSGETTKQGFAPDDLRNNWQRLLTPSWPVPCGLMTMAPLSESPEAARPTFHELRLLRDELQQLSQGKLSLPHLSMGMSGDFEVAVEEGATLIRIGSLLFEGLPSA